MAVSLIPLLQVGLVRRGPLYLLVMFLSVNTWAAALRAVPDLAGPDRRRYFWVFGSVVMTMGCIGTTAGYVATGALPEPVILGLIFLNPLFFALIFAATRSRAMVFALGIGAVMGPFLHQISPDWGLMVTGLVGGTAAFGVSRALPGKGRQS